jgi:serine/threonine-protein kinase RsbW
MREPTQDGSFRVAIPSDPAEARNVQELIERQLRSNFFEDHEIFSIKLALEEALVNAIKHGNRMDRSKKVHIDFRVNQERFDINVVDEGRGFDPQHVPDPVEAENLERPCGRGLLLMRHYMTEVTFHAPGNRLSMSKVRNGRSANDQAAGGLSPRGHRNGHASKGRAQGTK